MWGRVFFVCDGAIPATMWRNAVQDSLRWENVDRIWRSTTSHIQHPSIRKARGAAVRVTLEVVVFSTAVTQPIPITHAIVHE